MSGVAFVLVLASAALHASWNLLLKRSEWKGAFLAGLGAVAFAVFLIPATYLAARDGIGLTGAAFGLGSALLHGVYGRLLARGYRLGDLSTVYPIARGLAPALVPLAAVLFLGEHVSAGAGIGIAFVVIGIAVVQSDATTFRDLRHPLRAFARPAVRVALLIGGLITTYSLWDKSGLEHLPAITLNQFSMTGHMLLLMPLALENGATPIREEWRDRRVAMIAAGVFAPLAYVLVLTAMTTGRVSYIAPAREVGIVIGTVMGIALLGEGFGLSRVAGSVLIVAGAFTIGLSP